MHDNLDKDPPLKGQAEEKDRCICMCSCAEELLSDKESRFMAGKAYTTGHIHGQAYTQIHE